ncbi:hypothetical protein ANCDUO_23219 [Ancylostoma duodenale]|uniref:Uncharacterized protein n=1 Tax=Ancylostoma duodenale TaxID=51022 RepID=A0A0C2FPE6_9BILA|nr:hypothetical protein ANCDUO_23219 [Ancylostoma duodenale]
MEPYAYLSSSAPELGVGVSQPNSLYAYHKLWMYYASLKRWKEKGVGESRGLPEIARSRMRHYLKKNSERTTAFPAMLFSQYVDLSSRNYCIQQAERAIYPPFPSTC